jgi:hypothetical protein
VQVHGDVFRAAAHPMVFSALVGTGAQLAVVVLLTVIFAILGRRQALIIGIKYDDCSADVSRADMHSVGR